MRWYKDKKFIVGSILVPFAVLLAGWWWKSSPSNSITSGSGIVIQGQTGGNNIIIPFPASDPESAHRNGLLGRLRQEYILSHDGLSSALLAGTEPIPADWMNKRLAEMGESWRVRVKESGYEVFSAP